MLKSLDILIGLIVVLLALSMAVTVITQVILTAVNSRGRHLRRGLIDLLQQLDPALTPVLSHQIATRVLTHPLVSASRNNLLGRFRIGNVVHREEFTKLLLGYAAADGTHHVDADAARALREAVANNGIDDPAATLKNVRTVALQLERSNPELSHAARQTAAILQEANSDLIAKINGWFDQTMDRTAQRFTASTRAITFVAAALVAVGLQVDTASLVNRLAADDQLRAAFVDEAKAFYTQAGTDSDALASRYQSVLAATGIVKLPSSEGWLDSLLEANPLGLLITALLLSLGAPFWYNALGRLLQLRSALAAKDDAQRLARQSTDTLPAVAAVAATSAAAVAGEQGDLNAIG